jgi:heat shock protein HslJ
MKQLLAGLLLLVTLSANTCNNSVTDMGSLMMGKKWVFQSLAGKSLGLPEGTEAPWLKLAGDQLQGFGGCNSLMGQYTLEGTALKFPSVGSTKKYCEGIQPVETAITGMLGKVDSFKMDDGLLKLLGAGQELAALKAE